MSLGAHLGTIFLKISWHPGHCYLATSILQNAHFNLSSPPILGLIFDYNFMFWGVPFLDTLFSSLFQDDAQSHDSGTPFGTQLEPKWRPETTKWRQTTSIFCFMVVPRGAPLFSRNHSNYCAVGTWWRLKGHFFDGDWVIFCVFCVSLWSVL